MGADAAKGKQTRIPYGATAAALTGPYTSEYIMASKNDVGPPKRGKGYGTRRPKTRAAKSKKSKARARVTGGGLAEDLQRARAAAELAAYGPPPQNYGSWSTATMF